MNKAIKLTRVPTKSSFGFHLEVDEEMKIVGSERRWFKAIITARQRLSSLLLHHNRHAWTNHHARAESAQSSPPSTIHQRRVSLIFRWHHQQMNDALTRDNRLKWAVPDLLRNRSLMMIAVGLLWWRLRFLRWCKTSHAFVQGTKKSATIQSQESGSVNKISRFWCRSEMIPDPCPESRRRRLERPGLHVNETALICPALLPLVHDLSKQVWNLD